MLASSSVIVKEPSHAVRQLASLLAQHLLQIVHLAGPLVQCALDVGGLAVEPAVLVGQLGLQVGHLAAGSPQVLLQLTVDRQLVLLVG